MLSNILAEMANYLEKSNKQTPKQKKIIEAAITIFAEKGYANTSTSEIAMRAGVAEGTIFKHYGTKENLLISLLVPFMKDFFPAMADDFLKEIMDEEASFEDFLRAFIKNRIVFFSENREVFQVLIKEIIYRQELKNEILPFLKENASQRLAKIFDVYKERGQIKDLPNSVILKNVSTIIGGFFVSRFVLLNAPNPREEEIDELVDFVLNGIGQSAE
ncbi:MAG: TetR/AcrR family transcriptional regulator [Bacillus sp. (in: firmicutes)]